MGSRASLIHHLGLICYRLFSAVARLLPLPALFLIGRGFGFFGYFLLPGRRRLASTNIRRALGVSASKSRALTMGHFQKLAANLLCSLKVPHLNGPDFWSRVTWDFSPELKALPPTRGWVAVLDHSSLWELAARMAVVLPDRKIGAIYQPLKNEAINRHFLKLRQSQGIRLFDRKKDFWEAVSFLEAGGILGVFSDQFAGDAGLWTPFFCRLTSTSPLAANLAHRTGAALVPVRVRTSGTARWHVFADSPLSAGNSPEEGTLTVSRHLEDSIRKNPDDWLWTHNRWKTPPFAFLLATGNRRIFLPRSTSPSNLQPFRVAIIPPCDSGEWPFVLPAIFAIRQSRPDIQIRVLAPAGSWEFWKKSLPEGESIFLPSQNPSKALQTLRASGPFEAALLMDSSWTSALLLRLAGIPVRLGTPGRPFLNHWKNPPGVANPPSSGQDRYTRIAGAAGADCTAQTPPFPKTTSYD